MSTDTDVEVSSPMHIADRRLWSQQCGRINGVNTTSPPPVILMGAGVSAPYLPVANALKLEILTQLVRGSAGDASELDALSKRITLPHITLELFFSMLRYRCPEQFRPVELWDELCSGVPVNPLARSVAALRRAGLVGPMLTTNFDQMIPDALIAAGLKHGRDFHMVTDRQLRDESERVGEYDLCALHGTVYRLKDRIFSPPFTAMARGLARPFSPGIRRYLHKLFASGRPVLVIGYSGQDHYDINPILHELHSSTPDSLLNWLWVCHEDRPDERLRISKFLTPEQIVVGDATEVLGTVAAELGLVPHAAGSVSAPVEAESTGEMWRTSLARAMTRFNLPPNGVRSFLQDLRVNLPGAWVVLEHYRLFSAGFDEQTALTFGGVESPQNSSAAAPAPHLTYLLPPHDVPFGQLLNGQFTYRIEDTSYWHTDHQPATESLYPLTTELLTNTLTRFNAVLSTASAEDLRAEDRALLLVGVAIAEDYLGLMERKRSILLAESDGTSRRRAIDRFKACTRYADLAGEVVHDSPDLEAHESARMMLDDLVQYHVWSLIGKANVARTLDREEAIDAYWTVIEQMQVLIEQERVRSSEDDGSGDYLTAYDAQLWLRASELIKTILHCDSETSIPCSWDDLTVRERELATSALRICQEAHSEYERLSAYPNSRYPARFEAAILFYSSQGAGVRSLSADERDAAWSNVRSELGYLLDLAAQHPGVKLVRSDWIERIERRTTRLLSASHG